MIGRRPGIVLPAVLAVLIALGLLSALALSDALLDWRAATLADDAVRARAAALRGLADAPEPPDLAALCVAAPLAGQGRVAHGTDGTSAQLTWRSLGTGVVRVDVVGRGPQGAKHALWALMRPDSAERVTGLFRCPAAMRLVPVDGRWRGRHPEG